MAGYHPARHQDHWKALSFTLSIISGTVWDFLTLSGHFMPNFVKLHPFASTLLRSERKSTGGRSCHANVFISNVSMSCFPRRTKMLFFHVVTLSFIFLILERTEDETAPILVILTRSNDVTSTKLMLVCSICD